jgi:hypothetical protein
MFSIFLNFFKKNFQKSRRISKSLSNYSKVFVTVASPVLCTALPRGLGLATPVLCTALPRGLGLGRALVLC